MSDQSPLLERTVSIVMAFVANNAVRTAELQALIAAVHTSLARIAAPHPDVTATAMAPKPAVQIKKSLTDNHVISLETGQKLKALRRHLTGLGLTPDQYRAKWGLPSDYPMVAPGYAAERAAIARSVGLGRKPLAPEPLPDSTAMTASLPEAEPATTLAPLANDLLQEADTSPGMETPAPSGADATTPVKRRGRPRKTPA